LPLVILTGDQLADAALGGKKAAGSTVLVTGAVGAVGRVAAFVLKQRGAKVLVGVRGKQLEDARKLNADGVVALDDEAALAKLPTLDAVADTVGGEAAPSAARSARRKAPKSAASPSTPFTRSPIANGWRL
jgi:NADPH:quinone reductase-like Zn-dependent oxidoreductase